MHKQKKVIFDVDEKMQPIIQFIIDKLPGLIPIASCQGGDSKLNESEDSYILLVVRNIIHLDKFMKICGEWQCQYIKADFETGNVPLYRISLQHLDETLKKIK